MSGEQGKIQYNVEANVAGFVESMRQVPVELEKAGEAMDSTTQEAKKLDSGLSSLKKAFISLGVAKALKDALGAVEGMKAMNEQVRLNTASTGEYLLVQERLATTANGTFRALSEAQQVYVSTQSALKGMGYSTTQVLDITDSLSYSLVRNAASVDKAKTAIDAYSKAIQKGKVDADGWASILSAVPTVVNDIAASTGKTAEQIRKMGAEGKLAADMLNQGLLTSLKDNKDAADGMATSTKDAMMQMRNNFVTTITAMDEQVGATAALSAGIQMAAKAVKEFGSDSEQMANFLTLAGTAGASAAAIIGGRLVGALAAQAAAQASVISTAIGSVNATNAATGASLMLAKAELAAAQAAMEKLTAVRAANLGLAQGAASTEAMAAASARLTAAQASVATALAGTANAATYTAAAMKGLNTVMTFLGGPLGVIMIAAAALYYFSNAASETKVNVDQLNGSLDKLSFAQLSKSYNDAGDDIEKLNKKLSASMSELRTMSKRAWETDGDFAKRKTEQQATYDGIQQEIKARNDLRAKITEQQAALTKQQQEALKGNGKTAEHKTSDEDEKVLKSLRDSAEAAKLAGEARARLIAVQRLSADASEKEKLEAGNLAVEIYRATEAKKENTKATNKEETAAEQNAKAIREYAISIGEAAMKGEDLARAKAQAKLNKFATPEDVQTMDNLAKALYDVQNATRLASVDPLFAENKRYKDQVNEIDDLVQRKALDFKRAEELKTAAAMEHAEKVRNINDEQSGKKLLAEVSPVESESQRFEGEMRKLQELREMDVLNNQQYLEMKAAAEKNHDEQNRQLQEAAFIRQSDANKFLMSSIDALGSTTTQVFSGILSGTMNAQQAMQAFGQAIFSEAIGALVQMGVQAVKTMIIQKSASAAAGAAYAGSVAAQVATTTALAGQAAFASTAAIPVVGPAAAPGAATAAISAASALGAPAVSASVGVAGGRLYGGAVDGDSMYKINEDGNPEIFQANNGDQFMLPGTNGSVISNKNATGGGGMMVNIEINVDSGGSSVNSSGDADSFALAEKFKAMTLTVMEEETRQGGILWNMQNDRY